MSSSAEAFVLAEHMFATLSGKRDIDDAQLHSAGVTRRAASRHNKATVSVNYLTDEGDEVTQHLISATPELYVLTTFAGEKELGRTAFSAAAEATDVDRTAVLLDSNLMQTLMHIASEEQCTAEQEAFQPVKNTA